MTTDPALPLPHDERFLVLAPTGRDGLLTRELLRKAGLSSHLCRDMEELATFVETDGAAALLIAQEALDRPALARLRETIEGQPSWSDLPVLLFTGTAASNGGTASPREVLSSIGNVTLLPRPLQPITMISAAQSALRARRRQYAARQEIVDRERAVQMRDQFLAMLGHELRNPLGVIQLAADTMVASGSSSARQLEIVRRQTRNLGRLVDDLLDVARVTAGKIVLNRVSVDLVALVRRAILTQLPGLQARGLVVEQRLPERPVWILGDPVRLEQVAVNLLTNAIKYTPARGRVTAALETAEGRAILRLTDTGVGLAPESVERIFDLFAQAQSSLDRSQGGLGVGLTLVRRLLDLHGGTIQASSPGLGFGTTFTVTLPLAPAPAHTPEHPTDAPGGAGNGMDILVVEDNPDNREMLEVVLASFGHRVTAASNGLEGVERAIERRPQVALVDIGLPGIDGYDVARRVRAALGQGVYLVALTGYGQPDDRQRAFEAGFDMHLTKPVDIALVRKLLAEHRPAGC